MKNIYKKYKRIFLIVLDSMGVGASLDAKEFHDESANTLLHTIEYNGKNLPNLARLGLLNLVGIKEDTLIDSYYTRGIEVSRGKDTLTGHLEMMGIETKIPFKTFTDNGFPDDLIRELEKKCGRGIIGNKSASGTEIIEELGQEHLKTGKIIVYTSADSVLQIAAHEDVVPLDELYKICQVAREITKKDEWKVGRIIARPFIGSCGNFTRTSNRHDYALNPEKETVLDRMKNKHLSVIGVGKISDIFNGCGITESIRTKDNLDGINKTKEIEKRDFTGLCFINLNDFDSKYGHRRDPIGYMNALLEFDSHINEIKSLLKSDDLMIITADHGNDPTYKGTDHTREMTPVLIYNKNFTTPKRLADLETFASIGATIADNFNIKYDMGKSILEELK